MNHSYHNVFTCAKNRSLTHKEMFGVVCDIWGDVNIVLLK